MVFTELPEFHVANGLTSLTCIIRPKHINFIKKITILIIILTQTKYQYRTKVATFEKLWDLIVKVIFLGLKSPTPNIYGDNLAIYSNFNRRLLKKSRRWRYHKDIAYTNFRPDKSAAAFTLPSRWIFEANWVVITLPLAAEICLNNESATTLSLSVLPGERTFVESLIIYKTRQQSKNFILYLLFQ